MLLKPGFKSSTQHCWILYAVLIFSFRKNLDLNRPTCACIQACYDPYRKLWQFSTRSHVCKQDLNACACMLSLLQHSIAHARAQQSISFLLPHHWETMTTPMHVHTCILCMNLPFKIKISRAAAMLSSMGYDL